MERVEDPLKKFCRDLVEDATEIIDCKKIEMLPLTTKFMKKIFSKI